MRLNLELAHAKKKYLTEINDREHQIIHYILHVSNETFEKNHGITPDELLKKYPVSDETYNIWKFIAIQSDEKLKEYFGMSCDELSFIYPTTKEEVAIIHKHSTMSDGKIINTYNVCKNYIYSRNQKHKSPLIKH